MSELDESGDIDLDNLDTPSDNSNEFEWEGKRLDCLGLCSSPALVYSAGYGWRSVGAQGHL